LVPYRARETTIQSIGEETLKKMIAITFTLLLMATAALAQGAQPEKKKESKSAKAAPKSDEDVQKRITDKFATSKNLTAGAATVSGGEATLTGEAKNAGAKTSAGKTAHGRGAKKITNNISVAAAPAKAPAKAPKKQ
jgi:osmotically-inducible protein OsmY